MEANAYILPPISMRSGEESLMVIQPMKLTHGSRRWVGARFLETVLSAIFRSKENRGIAKLFAAERKALAVVGSRGHFGCIIGPETERIGAGVAV